MGGGVTALPFFYLSSVVRLQEPRLLLDGRDPSVDHWLHLWPETHGFWLVLSHFCFVFLFEEWVLEIVCSHFCCHNSTNPISNQLFDLLFLLIILYYIDPRHYLLHLNKLIFSLSKPILWSVPTLSRVITHTNNNIQQGNTYTNVPQD